MTWCQKQPPDYLLISFSIISIILKLFEVEMSVGTKLLVLLQVFCVLMLFDKVCPRDGTINDYNR